MHVSVCGIASGPRRAYIAVDDTWLLSFVNSVDGKRSVFTVWKYRYMILIAHLLESSQYLIIIQSAIYNVCVNLNSLLYTCTCPLPEKVSQQTLRQVH